jgi:hypothetical protein
MIARNNPAGTLKRAGLSFSRLRSTGSAAQVAADVSSFDIAASVSA